MPARPSEPKWQTGHGHAIASARYGAMSPPGPSPEPEPELSPQAELLRRIEQRDPDWEDDLLEF
jgi:hypothetical protein